MTKLKVLGICGSLREGSYNRKLLKVAAEFAASYGAEYSEFDLKKTPLPVYDGDIEDSGFPDNVNKLKSAAKACDVILFASPEYNHSIPGGLKNALDWASRGGNSWDNKIAAIFGASGGVFGTVRGQLALRQTLTCLNILVLPSPQVFVGNNTAAFNEDGSLKDKKTEEILKQLIEATLKEAEKKAN